MKRHYLSTPAERIAGILFSVVMSCVLLLLLYVLRNDLAVFLLTAAGVLLVVGLLALYVLNVNKACCIYEAETKTLRVLGFRERVIDLSQAAYLQTLTVKSGHVQTRKLVFTDGEDNVIASVPTYFTSNQGVLAEPMAMALAREMNIEFIANVPVWEYDKEARKAHDLEVERQEKEDARARREGRKVLREAKIREKMEAIRKEKK